MGCRFHHEIATWVSDLSFPPKAKHTPHTTSSKNQHFVDSLYHHQLATSNLMYPFHCRVSRSIRQSAHVFLSFRPPSCTTDSITTKLQRNNSPVGAMSLFNLVTDLALGWGAKASTPPMELRARAAPAPARRQVRRQIMMLRNEKFTQDVPHKDTTSRKRRPAAIASKVPANTQGRTRI